MKLLIAQTSKHNVYQVLPENVVMKVLKIKKTSQKNINRLDNEQDFDNIAFHHSIRRSLRRSIYENEEALFLEWAPGVPLSQIESLNIKEFLSLAREIAGPLLEMHSHGVMHMDLCCAHIIFNTESRSIKIISCGAHTNFNYGCYLSKQEINERDLRFISPEQTGRTNKYVDHRSDLYSLGIIFYKLLTGVYPFENENMWNLLHMHIIHDPVPVCSVNPNIPKIVSDMISRLIAKNADDRYQTMKGIVHDLDLMISEYDNDNELSSIELALHDKSEMLILPQKLYGRSADYNALLSAFGRISSSFELVMVSGESGTGKSALVFDLYKDVAQAGGMVISGKYNFSKLEPYSALLIAFNNFCEDLLLKDTSTIQNYKYRIQNEVGEEGGILTSLITNLHSIIGQQPPVTDAFGQAAKNRFHYVFVKLIKAICSVGFPIVLVLEDLQWMDIESFSLLSTLIADKTIKNLMLVGTYRENEINDTHSLKACINDLEKSSNTLTQIKLNNFDHETLNGFVSDALCFSFHETYALTALFMEKTKGNPFFVHQIIRSLSEQGLLFFSSANNKWEWDPTIFGEIDISKSVLGLLRLKILALDENTQQVLKVASCLGSSFSLQTLKLIVNRSDPIERALSTGMIIQQNGSEKMYRFAQDQIQTAAYSLLPGDPREIFFYIGKKLRTLYSENDLNENIFMVTHLLYNAKDLIVDQTERLKVAELFLLAGNKAITSTAFTQAFEYLIAGMVMLGEECWKTDYDLSLRLYNSTAKAASCSSKYNSLNECIEAILNNATTVIHAVPAYILKIKYYNDRRMFQDAFDTAMDILEKIGENFNYSQSEAMSHLQIVKAKIPVSDNSLYEILELKTMEDEHKLAAMAILSDILPCIHFIKPHLYFHISIRMVHLTLDFGISKYSCLGFSALGSSLCSTGGSMMGTFPYQIGKLSIILLERQFIKEFSPLVFISFFGFISPLFASIHESIDPFLDIVKVNLEIGSHFGTGVSVTGYCAFSFLSGKNLEILKDYIDEMTGILPISIKQYSAIHQATLNLLGENEGNSALLCGRVFDYESIEGTIQECDLAKVLVFCSMVAYFFHDYSSCLKFVRRLRPSTAYIANLYHYPMMLFFEGLVSLAIMKTEGESENSSEVALQNIEKLRNMSKYGHENHSNKVALLDAELAVARKDSLKAKACFKEAIALSRKHGFIHEEGLAYEREGLFLLETDSLDAASPPLRNAYNCFEKWGAKALSQALTKNHPTVFDEQTMIAFKKDTTMDLQLSKQSDFSVSAVSEMSCVSNRLKRKRVTFKL